MFPVKRIYKGYYSATYGFKHGTIPVSDRVIRVIKGYEATDSLITLYNPS